MESHSPRVLRAARRAALGAHTVLGEALHAPFMETLTPGPCWNSIWAGIFGRFNEKSWQAVLGVSVAVVGFLWDTIPEASKALYGVQPVHLLWLLSWLKEYNTLESHAAWWRCDVKTFHKRTREVMMLLLQHLNVIHFDERLQDGPPLFDLGYIVIDACVCPVQCDRKTWHSQKPYFSPKHGCHGLKYEMAVHWRTGRIVWLAGGVVASTHDLTVARTSGILTYLRQYKEYAFADKGYIGEEDVLLCPFKGHSGELTTEQSQWNSALGSQRIIVENVFARVTKFAILQRKYRGALRAHPDIFRLCASIAQVDMRFHPIRADLLEQPERHAWLAAGNE